MGFIMTFSYLCITIVFSNNTHLLPIHAGPERLVDGVMALMSLPYFCTCIRNSVS